MNKRAGRDAESPRQKKKQRQCVPGCDNRAVFSLMTDGERELYCKIHKTDEMINVDKHCAHSGCKIIPYFNIPSETRGLFCDKHKQQGMVNVKDKRCAHDGCQIRPIFNFPTETRGLFCNKHKQQGMVNVTDKRCAHDGCQKRPSFNIPTETRGLYCSKHKQSGMIDVQSRRCAHDGCRRGPSFNISTETFRLFCDIHKQEGMTNVKIKKCAYDGCNKEPCFNAFGEKHGIFCTTHKQKGMIDVKSKRCIGGVNFECPFHTTARTKYRNHCARCFRYNFPNDPLTQKMKLRTHEKELRVRNFINLHFDGFTHDKPLETSHCDCTHRRRIDHRKLVNGTLLAIETDENQHRSYDAMDEETRYNDLFMAYSGNWIYIRFNPDPYVDSKGETRNPTMNSRLKVLKEEIEKQTKRIESGANLASGDLIERVYLFYDGFQ